MNILLLKRQLWAPPAPITLRSVETITEPIRESWGVFYHGEKIGHASQTITPKAKGYQIQDRSLLRLQLLGTTQNATTHLDMDVDQEWTLEKFNFVLQANDVRFHARGRVMPGKLILTVDSGGHVTAREITLTQPPYLAGRPQTLRRHPTIGARQGTLFFDLRSGDACPNKLRRS